MFNFKGKCVVITGGGRGIGKAMAERFAADGAEGVVLLDMDIKAAEETALELANDSTRVTALQCDVSSEDSVKDAFATVYKNFNKVDILVNNAGITRDAMFHKMTSEQFRQVIDVHVSGMFNCTRQVVERMREQQWGRIISLSSTSANGNIGQSNYSAAKSAVIGFTKTLAMELGPKGITVNCIAPGMIDTDMIKTIPDHVMSGVLQVIPLRRSGKPEEVANLAAFLASDEASYITGECIFCSGGLH